MRTIMVSNDLNLINKAKICNLEAFNFRNLNSNLITLSFDKKKLLSDDFVSGQKESADPLLENFICTLVNLSL